MDKSPDAFRTISEVAESLDTPAHVLRFWESRFPQIKPVKRAGGRRYYRPSDVALLTGIKRLLHDEGLTIRGVQKILRDQGVRHVAGLSDESTSIDQIVGTSLPDDLAALPDEVPEAGFIAIEDPEPEPEPEPAPPRRVARAPTAQSELPLFDTPPALARAEPPPKPAPVTPRKPSLRDDATFASLIRGLPAGSLKSHRGELAALVRRLAALRAQAAVRAEGGAS
jgi:DNA-binding transcriptional MerR regulator